MRFHNLSLRDLKSGLQLGSASHGRRLQQAGRVLRSRYKGLFCSLVTAYVVSDRESASLKRGVIYSSLENVCQIHDAVLHKI